ncbi:hypothetical protein [Kitasatospora griseola]|uniref:hypothetical protein n=1 Tax=Kitasatospora griseola TaxID=2064 RepID=UPI0016702B06|nr:hypothetical protein [Kitasatospora griseola]GGR04347.1 hypothetical protein GCM10010195_69790 [Kitasatospora griseola]
MDLDHLYRIPAAAALCAAYGAFCLYAMPRSTWKRTRFGQLTPVLWCAVLGTALGTVSCTPTLRHFARIVLIDHPMWINIVVLAVLATAVAALLIADSRHRKYDDPEQAHQS